MSARKLTRLALLTAAALAVYVAEARIPPIVPIPGIKLGLANAVTLFAMYMYGLPGAALVAAGRILLGGFASGGFSMLLYSLAGGFLSFFAMAALIKPLGTRFSFVTGAVGGLAHNLAQLVAAVAVTKTPELFLYLPALLVSGAVTGAFTGLCAGIIAGRFEKYWL
ncbi:MAG: Gx transporter family protein [Oscillospiraceae bacterium]|jgi:heptaprenyl diphosphate synthase|nr:Gx transporter family protein [Oscillospiraceae bacterium]